jgi:pSer/pThr/pTyr-binding forkhead associated (FHA) protein
MRVGGGRNAEPSHKLLMLEYCHYIPGENETGWQGLEQVKGPKHVVGRESSFPPGSSLIDYLASDHLRILIEGNQVAVEEGSTINGAYLNIPPRRPVELKAGTKFVVGEQVIVFELPEPPILDPTVISLNHEKLRWQRFEPLAYLTFIGPGNDPGIRFPITKADQTTIGREGDIALGPDRVASRLHARVFLRGDRFYLEDMASSNGTFVRIEGRTTIKPGSNHSRVGGDELLIGAVLVRVMEY